mmetsp:Transcript_43916/g.138631  ORF Transcript_43916/g.138631 Transcript_43916/m.138631 type:complete len:258 (-) Transcript_43916:962-1735(-)
MIRENLEFHSKIRHYVMEAQHNKPIISQSSRYNAGPQSSRLLTPVPLLTLKLFTPFTVLSLSPHPRPSLVIPLVQQGEWILERFLLLWRGCCLRRFLWLLFLRCSLLSSCFTRRFFITPAMSILRVPLLVVISRSILVLGETLFLPSLSFTILEVFAFSGRPLLTSRLRLRWLCVLSPVAREIFRLLALLTCTTSSSFLITFSKPSLLLLFAFAFFRTGSSLFSLPALILCLVPWLGFSKRVRFLPPVRLGVRRLGV